MAGPLEHAHGGSAGGRCASLKRFGLRMSTAAGFTGTVYVDSIDWKVQ